MNLSEHAKKSRNGQVLLSFVNYCLQNPELRFWQALAAWCGGRFVFVGNHRESARDTFYWGGRLENED